MRGGRRGREGEGGGEGRDSMEKFEGKRRGMLTTSNSLQLFRCNSLLYIDEINALKSRSATEINLQS